MKQELVLKMLLVILYVCSSKPSWDPRQDKELRGPC